MQHEYHRIESASLSLSTTGDKFTYTPAGPVDVVRISVVAVAALAGTAPVVKADFRPTAGSDTGRGDGDVATLTLGASVAQGKVISRDIEPFQVDPGEQVVIECTAATSSGHTAIVGIEVRPRPFVAPRIDNVTKVTA